MLSPAKVAGELAYLDRAYTGGFERPYGWAWLLMLHREAQRHEADWAGHLAPLAVAFADRFKAYLPKLTYPIRTGAHYNTAFALILALEWADANDADARRPDPRPRRVLLWRRQRLPGLGAGRRRLPLLGADRSTADAPGPAADGLPRLVRRLPARLAAGTPRSLFTPAFVSDRSDGKIAHLDGVNLSRAWCWRGLAGALDPDLADSPAAPPTSISTPACPTSPATIWASTGSRPSRCWRLCAPE